MFLRIILIQHSAKRASRQTIKHVEWVILRQRRRFARYLFDVDVPKTTSNTWFLLFCLSKKWISNFSKLPNFFSSSRYICSFQASPRSNCLIIFCSLSWTVSTCKQQQQHRTFMRQQYLEQLAWIIDSLMNEQKLVLYQHLFLLPVSIISVVCQQL